MLPSPSLDPTVTADAVLLVHLADRACGLPLASVERVLPMAYVLPLPASGRDVVGVMNLHGDVLPVVDPRPRLGLPTPAITADQHLVLVSGAMRFLLWVDAIEEVVPGADIQHTETMQYVTPLVGRVIRLGDVMVPILTPAAFEPSTGSGQ